MDGEPLKLIVELLAIIGAAGGLWFRIGALVTAEAEKREELARDFNEFRLKVAEETVTAPALEKTESRLAGAFERFAARLETVVARLEGIEVTIARQDARQEAATTTPRRHRAAKPAKA